jgi:hypothetical protein
MKLSKKFQTIKERVHAAYHNLPYKANPNIMTKYLSMESTKIMNLFPAKGGVSPCLSPHTIMSGTDLDYN